MLGGAQPRPVKSTDPLNHLRVILIAEAGAEDPERSIPSEGAF
jgi:hypothetical protein